MYKSIQKRLTNELLEIKKTHKQIGYSGHLNGVEDAIAAIGFGAHIVEKHFTIDKNLPGRDNKFAILPDEMLFLTTYLEERKLSYEEHGTLHNLYIKDPQTYPTIDMRLSCESYCQIDF